MDSQGQGYYYLKGTEYLKHGYDRKNLVSYKDDWRKLAAEDVNGEPLDEFYEK